MANLRCIDFCAETLTSKVETKLVNRLDNAISALSPLIGQRLKVKGLGYTGTAGGYYHIKINGTSKSIISLITGQDPVPFLPCEFTIEPGQALTVFRYTTAVYGTNAALTIWYEIETA